MLPGIRFLFAATLLTISLLIFGFGAVALLRASHQQVASLPIRPPPTLTFSQQPDPAPPTLALLRFDPPEAEPTPATSVPQTVIPADMPDSAAAARSDDTGVTATATPPAVTETALSEPKAATVAEARNDIAPDVVAESKAAEPPTPAETTAPVKELRAEPATAPDAPPTETIVPSASSAPAQQTAAADPVGVIDGTSSSDDTFNNAPAIVNPPVPAERPAAAGRIAMISGPTVAIDTLKPTVKNVIAAAKPHAAKRKPVQARRVVKKRRVVARARPARPAFQAPASPFGFPLGT